MKFYNDSKATCVDATLKALEALSEEDGKTILILGGRGKNAPYAPLVPLIEKSVRTLVLIGEDADNIETQLKNHAEIIRADSMKDAVEKSFEAAEKSDSVLLAPACASFDMFKSFEERGKVFKEEVLNLTVGSEFSRGYTNNADKSTKIHREIRAIAAKIKNGKKTSHRLVFIRNCRRTRFVRRGDGLFGFGDDLSARNGK